MNKRHSILLAVMAAFLAIAGISCSKDDEEEIPNFTTGFVTVYTDSDGLPSVLKNDYGRRYVIVGEEEPIKPDTLFRMMCSYAFNNDSTVRILQKVFAMANRAVELEDIDSIVKDDPVQINSMYIGGGFLNIMMGVRVLDAGKTHKLGMVHLGSQDSLIFTVYHDADHDGQGTTRYAYVSMPLNGYGLNSGDTVFFKCKGYEKNYALKLVYR